jgi:hypothetical protein
LEFPNCLAIIIINYTPDINKRSKSSGRRRYRDWNTIKAAIEHGQAIPADASKEVLLGYHYALQWQSRQLAKERSEIRKRKDSAIAPSTALREARNNASYTNSTRHNRHGS